MENYQNLFSLDNKTALITGGTGGLGSAIALGFLQQGADVAVCGGHPEKAAGLADYAAQAGRKFLSLRCDIQKQADIDRMLDEIEEQFGTLDILVNSAGMNRLLPAEDYGEEAFDRVMGLTDIYAVSKVQRGVDFLREAGIPGDEAVFLGDTLHDAEVARAMGCQCLLIAGGHQKEETLRASGATVLPTLREAGDWIMERRGHEA